MNLHLTHNDSYDTSQDLESTDGMMACLVTEIVWYYEREMNMISTSTKQIARLNDLDSARYHIWIVSFFQQRRRPNHEFLFCWKSALLSTSCNMWDIQGTSLSIMINFTSKLAAEINHKQYSMLSKSQYRTLRDKCSAHTKRSGLGELSTQSSLYSLLYTTELLGTLGTWRQQFNHSTVSMSYTCIEEKWMPWLLNWAH